MQDISIRQATIDDLSILKEFEQGVIFAERPFDGQLKPDPISYYNIEKFITSDQVEMIVALDQTGKIIASAYAKRKKSLDFVKHEYHAYLGFMFVLPEFRGRGINQKMLDHLIEWSKSKGLNELQLGVYLQNDSAIKAYTKAGFKPYLMSMRMGI